MSEATLVALIWSLCATTPLQQRPQCFDAYVNCAVTLTGILTVKQFNDKCAKKERPND